MKSDWRPSCNFRDLWILTDSRGSIQHLKNWTYIEDKTSLSISQKLKLTSLHHDVHFQWIPSHVDIHGNKLVDNLAKEGSSHPIPSSSEITLLELFSRKKAQNKAEWLVPPSHHWYKGRKPGRIFTNPTLIELRQEIGQYHWLRGAVTSFSAPHVAYGNHNKTRVVLLFSVFPQLSTENILPWIVIFLKMKLFFKIS
ncbi:hypothetical protein AVEN_191898-1 [Araneus ventricosus]|uniref:RNase H type-1 domain-containing protein n=1 Tax=Araneus ventricosus TaxID=182803 RepID=A0A4Y2RSF8_ARAVE|nr:hypothetical protein AVEN_191898-1 [Araneus ventricosus]